MDIKKILLYIGATTVIFIGSCSVLTLGGCGALLGTLVWKVSNLPEYVDREVISEKYGEDFSRIHHALENKISIQYAAKHIELHDDIMAIFLKVNSRKEDLYMRYQGCSLNNYIISNGAGLTTLEYEGRSEGAIIYEISHNGSTYTVCIKDTFADS